MRTAVRAAARGFTTRFEGEVAYMYADSLGLVTCGIGNLIDPLPAALSLRWQRRSDGGQATAAEITAEWQAVKAARIPAWKGLRPLVLTPDALEALFFGKLDQNEAYLARRFPNWDSLPADAQLGCHSCAWAAGPAWRAPAFDAAISAAIWQGTQLVSCGDFRACAGKAGYDPNDPANRGHAWLRDTKPEDDARGVHTPTLNPGLRPRNVANQWLFQNAAVAVADGRDLETLYYPLTLDG